MTNISRRNFLKLSLFGMIGTRFPASSSFLKAKPTSGYIGRIATDNKIVSIYKEPDYDSDVIRDTVFDELVNLYYEIPVKTETGDALWYRVWGGYIPGKYIQQTWYKTNQPLEDIDVCGTLAEITVPYTEAYSFSEYSGWTKKFRLYFGTNHWITSIKPGPDKNVWYELTSELSTTLKYYVRCEHIRPMQIEEYLPTSIHVPPEEKLLTLSLNDQTLTAFEGQKQVYQTKISSGLGYKEVDIKDPLATATPTGTFHVTSKYPSKHMGGLVATGSPGSYALPGVPWTTFFIYDTGVAFHGTYWHNNFGNRMSHGCINMRNRDAKWLFRWVNPPYDPPYKDHCDWHQTGYGTRVEIS